MSDENLLATVVTGIIQVDLDHPDGQKRLESYLQASRTLSAVQDWLEWARGVVKYGGDVGVEGRQLGTVTEEQSGTVERSRGVLLDLLREYRVDLDVLE